MKGAGSRLGWVIPALFVLSLHPSNAEAHMTVQGMNHFTSGVLHPLMTPVHVIILIALGLWVGQFVPLRIKLPLGVFAGSSFIGLGLTMTGWAAGAPPAVLAGIALGAGAAVAVAKRLPAWVRLAFCAGGGLAIGLDSGAVPGSLAAVVSTLLGTWFALILGLLNVAHYVSLAAEKDRQWIHIGIRVVGSWIVAICLLMLAFALRR